MQSATLKLLDVSTCTYAERVTAAALQGLLNRSQPAIFLNYGIYDDPAARRTNEVFLDDEIWFGKYREMLGNQDLLNLSYYQQEHGFLTENISDLSRVVFENRAMLKGCVIWDEDFDDTVNIALMLAAQEDLLVIEKGMLDWAKIFELPIIHDLRDRWSDRVEVYQWAFENLFPKCLSGQIACIEPSWKRPEFIDYVVQNKIFTYNLTSQHKGWGQILLLMLSFGPAWLRELIFTLRLDKPMRKLGLRLMGNALPEIALHNTIQSSVQSDTYPTIFGWHTKRDDELAFMLLLSANGLRLVPSHLAGNFSFHARVPADRLQSPEPLPAPPELDPHGTYLTFTLSDGDQLMMMSTAQLGNWYNPQRGKITFNWEVQPLLVELAPALLQKFQKQSTPNDCLIAGPSGAGYIIPPLAPDLDRYMKETSRICKQAGIKTVTSYVADPPRRVLRQICQQSEGVIGFLGGYAIFSRTPQVMVGNKVFIANQIPRLAHIADSAEEVLHAVRTIVESPALHKPRFIGIHLFAYRTSYEDILGFVGMLNDPHVHVVRADVFLQLAKQTFSR
ncbi:MAG: hypothetical protein CVU46_12255 [Chloroflexi bacterium HGW-Chloroflexi-8]|nr:MAG: hypothetical protein CVU46_12255 [Chloroflexi bacterium HGW-Chloroflexi-8]